MKTLLPAYNGESSDQWTTNGIKIMPVLYQWKQDLYFVFTVLANAQHQNVLGHQQVQYWLQS